MVHSIMGFSHLILAMKLPVIAPAVARVIFWAFVTCPDHELTCNCSGSCKNNILNDMLVLK